MSNLLVDKNLLKHPMNQTKSTLVLGCALELKTWNSYLKGGNTK